MLNTWHSSHASLKSDKYNHYRIGTLALAFQRRAYIVYVICPSHNIASVPNIQSEKLAQYSQDCDDPCHYCQQKLALPIFNTVPSASPNKSLAVRQFDWHNV